MTGQLGTGLGRDPAVHDDPEYPARVCLAPKRRGLASEKKLGTGIAMACHQGRAPVHGMPPVQAWHPAPASLALSRTRLPKPSSLALSKQESLAPGKPAGSSPRPAVFRKPTGPDHTVPGTTRSARIALKYRVNSCHGMYAGGPARSSRRRIPAEEPVPSFLLRPEFRGCRNRSGTCRRRRVPPARCGFRRPGSAQQYCRSKIVVIPHVCHMPGNICIINRIQRRF